MRQQIDRFYTLKAFENAMIVACYYYYFANCLVHGKCRLFFLITITIIHTQFTYKCTPFRFARDGEQENLALVLKMKRKMLFLQEELSAAHSIAHVQQIACTNRMSQRNTVTLTHSFTNTTSDGARSTTSKTT